MGDAKKYVNIKPEKLDKMDCDKIVNILKKINKVPLLSVGKETLENIKKKGCDFD